MKSILNWDEIVNKLEKSNPEAHVKLNKIFKYYSNVGSMVIPPTFKEKALIYMGDKSLPPEESVKRIENQRILKFHNKWTGEGALFNSLRAQRPGVQVGKKSDDLLKLIEDTKKGCDFCNPEKYTPEDLFGRVKGRFCVTASNLAKYDAWSSLLIFKKHNPLDFSQDELSDYLDTAFNWFNRVYEYDENYRHPFLIWNCLYKAGASQVHGHAQILMTKEFPYAKMENLMRAAENYQKAEGTDYLKDLHSVHDAMGLAQTHGDVKYMVSLTPLKEKEVIIISPNKPSNSLEAKMVIYNILRCYIDVLGVESFNLAIYCPEITDTSFPYIIRIVDRGKVLSKTVDMGGMELYGSSVASDDPYLTMRSINEYTAK